MFSSAAFFLSFFSHKTQQWLNYGIKIEGQGDKEEGRQATKGAISLQHSTQQSSQRGRRSFDRGQLTLEFLFLLFAAAVQLCYPPPPPSSFVIEFSTLLPRFKLAEDQFSSILSAGMLLPSSSFFFLFPRASRVDAKEGATRRDVAATTCARVVSRAWKCESDVLFAAAEMKSLFSPPSSKSSLFLSAADAAPRSHLLLVVGLQARKGGRERERPSKAT